MRKKTLFICALILVILVSVAALWPRYKTQDNATTSSSLSTSVVEYGDIEESIQASGIIQPSTRVDIGVQVTGQVRSLNVGLGQKVKEGDLLATIDPSIATNELHEKEASLAQQREDLKLKYMDLDLAQKDLKRQKFLLSQDATARVEVEESEFKVKRAQSAINALNAQLQQSQAAVDSAQTKLLYTQIKAPITGDVINIATQPGQTLVASQQAPTLLTLAKMDTMVVTAQIPEVDIAQIKVGQKVYFTTLGEPEKRTYAKVEAIRPTAKNLKDAMFYEAFFTVPNPDRKLFIDMTVQVGFLLKEYRHVLLIPITALGEKGEDGRSPVKVMSQTGKIVERRIHVGPDNHIQAIVLDGLNAGEKVLTTPPPQIKENSI